MMQYEVKLGKLVVFEVSVKVEANSAAEAIELANKTHPFLTVVKETDPFVKSVSFVKE